VVKVFVGNVNVHDIFDLATLDVVPKYPLSLVQRWLATFTFHYLEKVSVAISTMHPMSTNARSL
jgi:hypothetical protein